MVSNKDLFNPTLSPFENFELQLKHAEAQGVVEPTAMSLATATRDGTPNNRMVLFKGFSEEKPSLYSFLFFTNYDSPKSKELIENPKASLCFFWAPLATQVRIQGRVEKMSRSDSEKYFSSRPEISKIGAWASRQSAPIQNYGEFEKKVEFYQQKFAGQQIPCPDYWGGWKVIPHELEFWFGVNGRLHYRYAFLRLGDNWQVQMLSP